ncbi:MAG: hypothetical protein IKG56_01530 [Clostridia bacterium]|nr:hypothetical protein [Clostridia bacterium]
MKVVDRVNIEETDKCKITFIRVNPEDKKETIRKILDRIANMSWINELIDKDLIDSMNARVEPTVNLLEKKLDENSADEITSETGEYFVSEISREMIVNELEYTDIPLAELWKEKISGNPGFDYHSENKDNIIIFGEAKYISNQNAYGRALKQIVKFIEEKKDVKELVDLKMFVSKEAINNANLKRKGYAIGFSSYSTSTDDLINNIKQNKDFKNLLKYEEMIIIAVDING